MPIGLAHSVTRAREGDVRPEHRPIPLFPCRIMRMREIGGVASALIVEDEPMIALDLEAILKDLGFTSTTLAMSVDRALAVLAGESFHLVLVDYKLGEETAEPVLEALARSGTPFIIVTGYSRATFAGLTEAPILGKPVTRASLSEALSALKLG